MSEETTTSEKVAEIIETIGGGDEVVVESPLVPEPQPEPLPELVPVPVPEPVAAVDFNIDLETLDISIVEPIAGFVDIGDFWMI